VLAIQNVPSINTLKKAASLNQIKNRLLQRYMETRDPEKYKEYTRQRNKVRAMTRKSQKDLEKDI